LTQRHRPTRVSGSWGRRHRASVEQRKGVFLIDAYEDFELDLRDLFCEAPSPELARAFGAQPQGSATLAEILRATHTGRSHPEDGLCYGRDHGDDIVSGISASALDSSCSHEVTIDPNPEPFC